jgi:hypothetical protein
MYKLTVAYDGNEPRWSAQVPDALTAFREYEKHQDWGFANEYSTVNLSMPDGKMYTKILYREGKRIVEK